MYVSKIFHTRFYKIIFMSICFSVTACDMFANILDISIVLLVFSAT